MQNINACNKIKKYRVYKYNNKTYFNRTTTKYLSFQFVFHQLRPWLNLLYNCRLSFHLHVKRWWRPKIILFIISHRCNRCGGGRRWQNWTNEWRLCRRWRRFAARRKSSRQSRPKQSLRQLGIIFLRQFATMSIWSVRVTTGFLWCIRRWWMMSLAITTWSRWNRRCVGCCLSETWRQRRSIKVITVHSVYCHTENKTKIGHNTV